MRYLISALACTLVGAAPSPSPDYRQERSIALGAPDHWDYVVADAATARVYVAHGDRVTIVDPKEGSVVGDVPGIAGGTHGVAIALGKGYTDDGENGKIVVFDLATRRILGSIAADADADAVISEPVTRHVLTVNGDSGTITVVDPKAGKRIATIIGGEKMEYAAADGRGFVFVAGEAKRDLLKIDARTNAIVARWRAPDCESPHGLAFDAASGRVFMGCTNKVAMVIDAATGRIVTRLPIGIGSDAIVFDAKRRRVFSSNGRDGTISVYRQDNPDHYTALEPISTKLSARTMALDPASGRLFVAAADTTPNPTPGGRPKVVPGTLALLVFAPTS